MDKIIEMSFTDDDFEAVSRYLDGIEATKPLDDYALFLSSDTSANIQNMFTDVAYIPANEPIMPVFDGL